MTDTKELLSVPAGLVVKRSGEESAVLGALTKLINTPEFSDTEGDGHFAPPDPIPTNAQQAAAVAHPTPPSPPIVRRVTAVPPAPEVSRRKKPERMFTSGRMKVGKDFILTRLGYSILGFADPLYALQKFFFGVEDKAVPGAREFLQRVGQWGRGTLTDRYPLTTERALFVSMMRALSVSKKLPEGVDWQNFGKTTDLWVDALLSRIPGIDPAIVNPIGVSNVRFENEHVKLLNAGFSHFHVMCSQQTWERRIKEVGILPTNPILTDESERLAILLDEDALRRVQMRPSGPKLQVIWNDPHVRCPSPRFYDLINTVWD